MNKSSIPCPLNELADIASSKGITPEEYLRQLILQNTLNSKEVAEILSVKPARIVALKRSGKLFDVKGLFIENEVNEMRIEQKNSKYQIDSENYSLIPCSFEKDIEEYGSVLFISKTRFHDCIIMFDRDKDSDVYVNELDNVFLEIRSMIEKNKPIFYVTEDDFRGFNKMKTLRVQDILHYQNIDTILIRSEMGLTNNELLRILHINKNGTERFQNYHMIMEFLTQKCIEDLCNILKKIYELKDAKFESEYEMGYTFKCTLAHSGEIIYLRVQKSSGSIFININNVWKRDLKHLIPKILLDF
ncbi:hypothetical protein [Rummeliibacillus stabekisii]|uniref:hypothetical protein n=1 Tax=Rummeliibacillus stabekisii TaxID=241244 RepID=UPI00371B9578